MPGPCKGNAFRIDLPASVKVHPVINPEYLHKATTTAHLGNGPQTIPHGVSVNPSKDKYDKHTFAVCSVRWEAVAAMFSQRIPVS